MGNQQTKRVENTGEVINEIINEKGGMSSLHIMILIITIIMVIQFVWKVHKAYKNDLKKKYKSSANLADI